MVRGDQSVVVADTRRGGMQMCASVRTQARGHLPLRLVSERLDETGAAVRFAGSGDPAFYGWSWRGWCLPWYQVGQDGQRGTPQRSQ